MPIPLSKLLSRSICFLSFLRFGLPEASISKAKLVTLKALRFAIILPVAFAAVIFIEVPKMIWQDRATELVSSGLETFIVVAVINLDPAQLDLSFQTLEDHACTLTGENARQEN